MSKATNTHTTLKGEALPARRGFLALVGSALLTGTVQTANASTPTLLLPPKLVTDAQTVAALSNIAGCPLLNAIRISGKCELDAFVDVKAALPNDLYLDWLEGGLRMVESCKPGGRIHRAMQLEGRA